jgi:hypothetical protein
MATEDKNNWREEDALANNAQEAVYRAAFPAYRVFIFGKEVSGDVAEVRVNHAGGSQDRSPGTCSITLVNPQDKYIIDHSDMIALSNSRDTLVSSLGQQIEDFKGSRSVLSTLYGSNNVAEYADLLKLASASTQRIIGEQISAEETSVVEELYELLQKGGPKDYLVEWSENLLYSDWIKYEVVQDKAKFRVNASLQTVYSEYYYPEEEPPAFDVTYEYPYQEGDCIFHPNDPIRIAFRDPFDPRIWYWMFTGFVDSFTEDSGVNQESIVTVTGTDVSKVARYSLVQMNTGILDEEIRDVFKDIPAFQGSAAATRVIAWAEIFKGFSIFEILELLFFGLDSFKGALDATTDRFIANLGDAEAKTYLVQNTNKTQDAVDAMSLVKVRETIKELRKGNKQNRFDGAHVPPVSTPRGVSFKRKNSRYGTWAFFVGDEIDDSDLAIDGRHFSLGDLRELNEILHHRVKTGDLDDMAVEGTPLALASSMDLERVITTIGTDIETYPVGGGSVVYVAPSTLGTKLKNDLLDKTVANTVSLHSEFKDRLSFLYDLAERIEFCCYATPRGDMVFEMPFYDFDTWMFEDTDYHLSNNKISTKVKGVNQLIGQIEDRTRTSGYSLEDVWSMMELERHRELANEGFTLDQIDPLDFNYLQHFTIEQHEQLGYSNSMNDQGMLTAYRAKPNPLASQETIKFEGLKYQYAPAPGLAPMLGFRIDDASAWEFTETEEAAKAFAALNLRRANANSRNIGLQIVPHFGLMVNRPLYWRKRNYMANIVSCQHSIVWNSSCDTAVNLNQVRGWTGSLDSEKLEEFAHFGGDTPFNLARIVFKKRKGA